VGRQRQQDTRGQDKEEERSEEDHQWVVHHFILGSKI
jgi:hypothetical protein